MKMVSKLMLTVLVGALALPVAGFAGDKPAETPKASAEVQKPKVDAAADCKTTGKKKGATATAKRKTAHANKGIVSGEGKMVVHNHDAAREHGAHGDDK